MLFCPKCGSILTPKKVDGKRVMGCSCGFVNKTKEPAKIVEGVATKHKKLEVIDERIPLPLVDAACPKCKHLKAYFWSLQTRAADEAETKFFRCEKCKYTWRDYD